MFENLEKLLLKNWTSFINLQSFTEYIVSLAKNTEPQIGSSDVEYPKGIQLKLSQFKLVENGFDVWVDFIVPNESQETVIGTTQLLLTGSGAFEHLTTRTTLIRKT